MLTPQEVSSKTFPKAVMGGYAMPNVDDFLDKLTEDYTNLYKDNAALKAKIKMLAEKMEEQRKSEDTFRTLILSAQKMADEIIANAERKRDEIVKEAEAHRDSIMGDAEAAARKRIDELRAEVKAEEQRLTEKKKEVAEEIAAEEYRLERARAVTAAFMEVAKSSCQEQLAILERVESAMPPAPERPAEPVAVVAPAPVAEELNIPEEEENPFFPVLDAEEAEEEFEEEAAEEKEENFFTSVVPSFSGLKNMLRKNRREEPEEYEDEEEDEYEEDEAEEDSVQDDIAEMMKQFAREDEEEEQGTLFTTEPEEETRVINLDDLQFGRNYNRED